MTITCFPFFKSTVDNVYTKFPLASVKTSLPFLVPRAILVGFAKKSLILIVKEEYGGQFSPLITTSLPSITFSGSIFTIIVLFLSLVSLISQISNRDFYNCEKYNQHQSHAVIAP